MSRNQHVLLLDLFFFAISPYLSFGLRLETLSLGRYTSACLLLVVLAVFIKPILFYFLGLYRQLWRYAGIDEVVSIIGAATLSSITIAVFVLGVVIPQGVVQSFPRSTLVIDWLFTIILAGGNRLSLRILERILAQQRGGFLKKPTTVQRRILIVGAGEAGTMLLDEIRANPGLGLLPVGFVDDDPTKHGMRIRNIPVLGPRSQIPNLVRLAAVEEVVIAMPTAPGRVIRETMEMCRQAGIPCRTIPGLYELINGTVTVHQIREIRIEDLLRREPVRIDPAEVGRFLKGARILVTGAGGSIGSELCRQLATYQPELLVLLGHGENSIFQIQVELNHLFPSLKVVPVIADIRDRGRVEYVFERFQPAVVFHSAAHKHVPLMEYNPVEAVTNNIFGTRNVVEAALSNGLERLVLISTDKAVNPVSVMGASKRVAELLIQEKAQRHSAALIAVRFGNVLGSRGSVVPVLQRQIAAGGPVTITHPEVRRFFMSIPEAAQLVLQAAAMGRGGEIFVLDMGDPIRVLDMARDLIRLHGLEPGRDIDIVFTGLRPGEKLCEELFFAWEKPKQTKHPKILVVDFNCSVDSERFNRALSELERLTREGNVRGVVTKLKELVPEFQPVSVLETLI